MDLRLTIRRPGSLLSKMLDTEINDLTYAQIVLLVSDPERFTVIDRGPRPPEPPPVVTPETQPDPPTRAIGFSMKKEA